MSRFRLYQLKPDDVTQAELIASADKERQIARSVFQRWPIAACLPYTQQDGPEIGAVVLTVWESPEDAKAKRAPVAIVRTSPPKIGFKQELWKTPASA